MGFGVVIIAANPVDLHNLITSCGSIIVAAVLQFCFLASSLVFLIIHVTFKPRRSVARLCL